ncbi:MAG: NAD-dependent epimerase/dehydratase family protein [Candidatus Promineifilaceae bacterium]|nr:NAD-dependent epimerase/dehydratase family protein [Candidatus Promineifilaceae bacterium]
MKRNRKRFAITGATGFVGSSLAKALVAAGGEVCALARPSSSPKRLSDTAVKWLAADISQPETLHGLFHNTDYVIHAAGMLGQAGIPEKAYHELHVEGTRHVLDEVAATDPTPKVLYISSPGVLGPINGPAATEDSPIAPGNPYERSKAVAEQLVGVYAAAGLPVVITRPEFIYGPGDTHVLGLFRAIQQGRFFFIGDGRNTCHPTYVSDAVDGMLRCLEQGKRGEIYHIAGPRPITFRELATAISGALGVSPPRVQIPRLIASAGAGLFEGLGRITHRQTPLSRDGVAFFSENRRFSWAKAKSELNYQPQIDIQMGTVKTVDWYRQLGYLT